MGASKAGIGVAGGSARGKPGAASASVLGIALLLVALAVNEWTLTHVLSPDGAISVRRRIVIAAFDVVVFAAGVAFLGLCRRPWARRLAAAGWAVLALAALGAGGVGVYAYAWSGLRVDPPPHVVDWRNHPSIVFESDDWGGAMVFADAAGARAGAAFLPSGWQPYPAMVNSTLEAPRDLERIFAVLERHRGGDGWPAVFTANYVLTNPDYARIAAAGYRTYHQVDLPQLPEGWSRGDIVAKAVEGMNRGVWDPAYHGAAHLSPTAWLARLQSGDEAARALFALKSASCLPGDRFTAEYAADASDAAQAALIDTGFSVFQACFGYTPRSSIAPNYVWQLRTEDMLARRGVRVIQAKSSQLGGDRPARLTRIALGVLRRQAAGETSRVRMGSVRASTGQVYLHRNVLFEPMLAEGGAAAGDPVAAALAAIENAWARGEPAVVITHRCNYVSLDQALADEGLALLERLLIAIAARHPAAVYLTDWEVGQQYLFGWSARRVGDRLLVRNFTGQSRTVRPELPPRTGLGRVLSASGEGECTLADDGALELPGRTSCVVALEPAGDAGV